VRQQVVKLQQQLADLQSSFDEEQCKAMKVCSCHLILALTSSVCSLLLPARPESQGNMSGRFMVLLGLAHF